ncbi:hypothetical protein LCGC14_2933760, partial [marine sediment metagenome]
FKGVPRLVPEVSITVEELHGRETAEDNLVYGPRALPEDSPLLPGGGIVSSPGVDVLKAAGKVAELGVLRDIEELGGLRRQDPEEFSPRRAQLEEEVAQQTALEVTSILDLAENLDVPRRVIGKPVARAALEPLALAADAANALSPANLPLVPSIRGVTRPPITGGQIRGATSVEILSYITDPLNAALFLGVAVKAARAATLGVKLSLAESQILRKAVPRARQLLAEEAGGRASKAAATAWPTHEAALKVNPATGKSIKLTGTRHFTPGAKESEAGLFFAETPNPAFGPVGETADITLKNPLVVGSQGDAIRRLYPTVAERVRESNELNKVRNALGGFPTNEAVIARPDLMSILRGVDERIATLAKGQGFDGIVYTSDKS